MVTPGGVYVAEDDRILDTPQCNRCQDQEETNGSLLKPTLHRMRTAEPQCYCNVEGRARRFSILTAQGGSDSSRVRIDRLHVGLHPDEGQGSDSWKDRMRNLHDQPLACSEDTDSVHPQIPEEARCTMEVGLSFASPQRLSIVCRSIE